MKGSPSALQAAIKQFPRHKKILETIYHRDKSFQSLCQDFVDCIQAVEYWCNSPSGKEHTPELCEEYRALCADLRKEIEEWLADQHWET